MKNVVLAPRRKAEKLIMNQIHFSTRRTNCGKNGKSAFTLIELLVVIAIIAILAAILFPVFARARENARRTSCLSNIKQLGLGIMQYTQDYDERYPMYSYTGIGAVSIIETPQDPPQTPAQKYLSSPGVTVPQHIRTWMDFVQPYIKTMDLFDCPSRQNPFVETDGASVYYPSLAMNGIIGGIYNNGVASSLADINDPTKKILMLHNPQRAYSGMNAYYWLQDTGFYRNPTTDDAQRRYKPMYPHLDGQNFMFADGHAKFAPAAKAEYWTCKTQVPAPTNTQTNNQATDANSAATGCGFWMPKMTPPSN